MSSSFKTKPLFLILALFAVHFLFLPSKAHAQSVSGSPTNTLINVEVGGGTNGLYNGTTVQYNVDTGGLGGFIELDVTNAATNVQIGAVSQILTPGQTTGQIFWNAFWLINGQFARTNGNYILSLLMTPTGGTAISFNLPTLVQLNSIDIHNVTVAPSLDSEGQSTFPFSIQYHLSKSAAVTVTVGSSTGTIVRTLISNKIQTDEASSTGTVVWDGKNDAGVVVPIGIYTSTITATDPIVPGSVAIPRSVTLTLASASGPGVNPQTQFEQSAFVYPNPVRNGQATFQYETVGTNAIVTLKIYTIDGTEVLSQTFSGFPAGSTHSYSWNVTNQSGRKLGRGLYYYVFKEVDSAGTLQIVKKMAIIP